METILLPVVAVLLSAMVLSRIVGDNPLYRLSQYLFIGVSLGYALVVAYHQVLRPALSDLLVAAASGNALLLGIRITPLLLGMLLFTRLGDQRSSWLANLPLALLFGVGAALTISGTIIGTLGPQVLDTATRSVSGSLPLIIGNLVLVIGVVFVLSVFTFSLPTNPTRSRLREITRQVGRWLLLISFGVFFASAVATYMSALVERLQFIVTWGRSLAGL